MIIKDKLLELGSHGGVVTMVYKQLHVHFYINLNSTRKMSMSVFVLNFLVCFANPKRLAISKLKCIYILKEICIYYNSMCTRLIFYRSEKPSELVLKKRNEVNKSEKKILRCLIRTVLYIV